MTDVHYDASPTFADIDGDGDLNAFIGDQSGNTLFFRNTGNASSAVFAAPVTNPFGLTMNAGGASPTLADIDGDGDLDAFIGSGNGNTLFYRNIGNAPVLSAPTAINYTDTVFDDTFATATGTLVASDIDNQMLTYSITGGTDKGSTISKSSAYGVLTLTKATGLIVLRQTTPRLKP